MRFALVSDVHFGPNANYDGKLRKLSQQAPALLSSVVRELNEREHPDLVINLGDSIEDESHESDLQNYGAFVRLLEEVRVPILHVAGNHDQVNLSDDDLRNFWKHDGSLHYARDFGGVRFLILRTIHESTVVHLPEEQLVWVERELALSDKPVIVAMHHPASDMQLEGNRWFAERPNICRVAERKRLRRLFEHSGKVIAVFNGHVHWNHLDVIAGIPYITLQSMIENLDEDAPGRAARAFAVCDLNERRLLVNVLGAEPIRYQFELPRFGN